MIQVLGGSRRSAISVCPHGGAISLCRKGVGGGGFGGVRGGMAPGEASLNKPVVRMFRYHKVIAATCAA